MIFTGGSMRRVVNLYMAPNDPGCIEIKEFLEQQDLKLQVHDVKNKPLVADEIAELIKHFNLKHFLNTSSKTYTKRKLDKSLLDRKEVIQLMADDNDLIRKPIIVVGRLMVVGANREKVMEMLQIKPNGSEPIERRQLGNIEKKPKK
jgi:regulatory protein spx